MSSFKAISKNTYKYHFIFTIPLFLIITALSIWGITESKNMGSLAVAINILLSVVIILNIHFCILNVILCAKKSFYSVDEKKVTILTGYITKKEVIVQNEKITNVSLSNGVIQRLFKLSNVIITMGEQVVKIRNLDSKESEALYLFLIGGIKCQNK